MPFDSAIEFQTIVGESEQNTKNLQKRRKKYTKHNTEKEMRKEPLKIFIVI